MIYPMNHSVKKEQLINWKILRQSEGQLLATNAYALLTSDYFSFSIARPENNAKKAVLQSANCKEQI